jgi:hypothetical protein
MQKFRKLGGFDGLSPPTLRQAQGERRKTFFSEFPNLSYIV